ncbi:hypothetical protein ACO0LB_20845, partial [Undibacterium sp. SXout7W]
ALEGKPKYVNDGALTPDGYAVNTMAPPYQPSYIRPAYDGDPLHADPADGNTLPPQTYDTIGDLLLTSATGARIPLAQVATIRLDDGESTITRELGKR